MKKLVSTLGMSHEDWLKYRKMGIGGSDAGAICGLNPYSSAIQVYQDKTSEDLNEFDNEAMRQGRDLEQYVAERFMEETGLKVRKANAIYCHEEYPYIMANIDRTVLGKNAGLECKTVSAYNADKWKDGQVPMHYQIQCHHYMLVTGAKAWYIAAVILGVRFVYQKIERDEEIINYLIQIEAEFWKEHVMKGIMPAPDGSKVCDEILSKYYPKALRTDTLQLTAYKEKLQRRTEIVEIIERMEKEKSQIEQEIKAEMGDFEMAECEDYRISWTNVTSSRIDTKRLKEEELELYKKYLNENYSRRFQIKVA
ncbi:MAG: YqaJ viral recombinase family protein [Lachnospiraceae bacterium]|nr:YqaJ viral recombinase family protein [Lachnospiraceae bacterium]